MSQFVILMEQKGRSTSSERESISFKSQEILNLQLFLRLTPAYEI